MSASFSDYLRNAGQPAQSTIPANNTNLTADSLQRRSNSQDEMPSNFTVNLSGPLDASLIYYNHLHWNQPLYSHNNTNNELRFQLWDGSNEEIGPSPIMIVYAMPFVGYKSFDGRINGASYQAPIGSSYGKQMEYALNNDVRTVDNNVALLNANGKAVWKSDDPTAIANVFFRYSSTRGYAIWATKENGDSVSVRILNCNWIEKGHHVHGFGRVFPGDNYFAPNSEWSACYYAEASATLLPYRFIVVVSDELTRERKTVSVTNAASSGHFKNELAILPLNCHDSGVYHIKPAGNDTTTVSLRSGNQPYSFRISILGETGKILVCNDPLAYFINQFDVFEDSSGAIQNGSKVDMFEEGCRPPADVGLINFLLFGSYDGAWGAYWTGSTDGYVNPNSSSPIYTMGLLNADMKPEDVIHSLTTSNKIG